MAPAARRLAAIVFTDIVGFTSLAQADEKAALELLERHHRLLRPLFPPHHGREVKTTGDGFLLVFDSALDAVACSLAIQRTLAEYNQASSDAWKIRVRVGVHLGDVTAAGTDIVGDAVNIASRIEPLAEPGGICVSEPVFVQVRNKLPARFVGLDARRLKNVEFPLAVYRVEPAPEEGGPSARSPARRKRLAVLPLANLSPDPQDEFFADGLTEEMITELSHNPGLEVIARTSVVRYKGATQSIAEVARDLKVDVVLEGSVRKSGNRLRITAQLIDAASEGHVWADRFDRELTDIFALQTEIAQQVAVRLGATLEVPRPSAPAPTVNLDAYLLYLKGRSLWNRRSLEGVQQALRNFEQAVALAPEFAPAHSGIADALEILSGNLEEVPWREIRERALSEARTAIAIDERSAEAHASLGLILGTEFAWQGAEAEFRRSIALNDGYAPGHLWYSRILASEGRFEEAAHERERAGELDPLSPIVIMYRAMERMRLRDDAGLLPLFESLVALEPSMAEWMPIYRAAVLVRAGRTAEAVREVERMESAWKRSGEGWLARLTWVPPAAYAVIGRTEEARRALAGLADLARGTYVSPFGLAHAYATLGDAEEFFRIMERASAEHEIDFQVLRSSILFDRMRPDPRFAEPFLRAGLVPPPLGRA